MRYIKSGSKRIELINFSIRTKLLLIYLLCVLIPIIVFSTVFYSSVIKSSKKEKIILYNQALDRLSTAIDLNAISAIELSNIIYLDQKMYEYLNKAYGSKKDCLDVYNSYLKEAWRNMLPYNTKIMMFLVYTSNDTLLNSSNVRNIDEITTESYWYRAYTNSDADKTFINHIDQPLTGVKETKLVSFFRKLDYVYYDKYQHFLKITFRADMFDRILRTEKLPGEIYITNQDDLIIAQSAKDGYDQSGIGFLPYSSVSVDADQIVLRTQIKALNGWHVICVLDRDFMKAEFRTGRIQIFFLMFFVTIFSSIIIWIISASLYKRIDVLVCHMGKVEKGEYTLISESKKGNDEIGLLIVSMNKMITKIKTLIEDVYKAKLNQAQIELLKKQSELNALQCQVNPHFMFNVLETIRIKSYLKNEFETARIIKYMSQIFRKLLMWNDDLIELQEEIRFIKEYLEIQQYRYEDELEFEITVEESLSGLRIPKMALQTFVDNACEHGFADSNNKKIVKVAVGLIDNNVEIRIYDNGKGMKPETIKNIENFDSKGIGIKNVIGRLNVYYKEHYDFKINSKPGEFTEIVLALDIEELRRCGYV